ncbi:MAG: FtsW/RodA/SpoVE family cell cycle protein [Lachnospiraceae bacterium]|nr:FtsW/RodA/SpoVE family cell cycle protein [Lachnospiraceae bacterium]
MFSHIFKIKSYNFKSFSLSIVAIVLALGSVGIFLIQRLQDADERQFEKQVLGYAIGLFAMAFVAMIDYHFICKFAIPLYILNLGLLLFTRFTDSTSGLPIYGKRHYKAKRWITFRKGTKEVIEFMPSELTKLIIIICLAVLLTKLQKNIKKFWVILLAGAMTAIPVLLVFMQPDLSTSIVIFLFFCIVLFVSGVSLKQILPIILVAVPVVFFLIWYVQQDWQTLLDYYQQKRILSLLNPTEYTDEMFQQNNAMLAIQAGGFFGKLLLGDLGPRLTDKVPVVESDFIFSAIGEEFGVFGMFLTIAGFLFFALVGIRIARKAKDMLGCLLAIGITSLITIQAFVNMGVVISLLPNTGIPLPFVSSGLTALISNLMTLGILLNVSMQPQGFVSADDGEYNYRITNRGSIPNDFNKIHFD